MRHLDRRTGAIVETLKAHIASTLNSQAMNVRARMEYWGANGSLGFRNCGKNAVKNRMPWDCWTLPRDL